MALKVVNTESLDAVANAINSKSGRSGALQFPEGFVEAVEGISAGGGGENYLAQFAEGAITELNPTHLAGCTAIGDYAFYYNRTIKNVMLPNSVISIGVYAFSNAYIESITLSENVKTIGSRAFSSSNLLSLYFPDSIEQIGESAVSYCSQLTNVRLPNNSKVVYDAQAIYNNDSLESLDIPCGAIRNNAFADNSYLKTLTIGEGVTQIGYGAFYQNTRLETVYYNAISVPDITGTTSGSGTFRYVGDATENGCTVYIGKNVKRIPNFLFGLRTSSQSHNITSIVFSNDSECEEIAQGAFNNCAKLKNVNIPKSITRLDTYFSSCKALEYIDLTAYGADGAFPVLTSSNRFDGCGTSTTAGTFEIRVPTGRKAELSAMTNWSTYADNIVEV